MTRPLATPGLDLARWWPDLLRLVKRKYSAWIERVGLDFDDVTSETARRILRANRGAHPFDPARGEAQPYILRQARAAIMNLADARRRWNLEGQELGPRDSEWWGVLAGSSSAQPGLATEWDTGLLDRVALDMVEAADLDPRELGVVRAFLEGHTREEIVALTGRTTWQVRTVTGRVQAVVRERYGIDDEPEEVRRAG